MSNNDVFPARHMEHSVAIPALFQAVKSYLHFSQLSAWLNQTRGSAPKSVEYRYFTLPPYTCMYTTDNNDALL